MEKVVGSKTDIEKDKVFSENWPLLMKGLMPYLKKSCETKCWLICDHLTPADFWLGHMYVSHMTNPLNPNKERYAKIIGMCPELKDFGERFRTENKAWLDKRPQCPM